MIDYEIFKKQPLLFERLRTIISFMNKEQLRLIVYNIRYCTGTGWKFHFPFPYIGYLKKTYKRMLQISKFIKSYNPDIVGLLEVDCGSHRTSRLNQAQTIGHKLGHFHIYQSKYHHKSFIKKAPLFKHQGNAFLTSKEIRATKLHYFDHGVKRLVIELELENCVLFLVHLSLKYRHRHYQLNDLAQLIKSTNKPVIIAGDFNVLWGNRELELFLAATNLSSANSKMLPTFPSNSPSKQIDYILHSQSIEIINFQVPNVEYSDHLPLICDFKIK